MVNCKHLQYVYISVDRRTTLYFKYLLWIHITVHIFIILLTIQELLKKKETYMLNSGMWRVCIYPGKSKPNKNSKVVSH